MIVPTLLSEVLHALPPGTPLSERVERKSDETTSPSRQGNS